MSNVPDDPENYFEIRKGSDLNYVSRESLEADELELVSRDDLRIEAKERDIPKWGKLEKSELIVQLILSSAKMINQKLKEQRERNADLQEKLKEKQSEELVDNVDEDEVAAEEDKAVGGSLTMKQIERMMIRVIKISNQSKQSISIMPDMSSKIPMFAGKPGEKVDRWLEKLNSVAEHQKWDKKLKLHVAVNHLTGNAEFWQEYQGRSLIHCNAWLTKFKETFDRTLTTREWNRKCEERRQREGESVEDFI